MKMKMNAAVFMLDPYIFYPNHIFDSHGTHLGEKEIHEMFVNDKWEAARELCECVALDINIILMRERS